MLSFTSPSLPPSSLKLVLSTADAQAWSSRDSLLSVSESDFHEMHEMCLIIYVNGIKNSYLYVTFSVLARRIGHSSRSWLLVRGWLLCERIIMSKRQTRNKWKIKENKFFTLPAVLGGGLPKALSAFVLFAD